MDCGTSFNEIMDRCKDLNIDCVAIADHGTIEGAIEIKKIAPFRVIVAEEILTPQGEIMGLFLKETIPSNLSVTETVAAIKEQGGLVCIPHPFDPIRNSSLDNDILTKLAAEGQIDIIEVINSRYLLQRSVEQSRKFALKYNLVQSAGSDAHTVPEIGNAYVELAKFKDRDDFLMSLANGRPSGHRTNPLVHFRSLAQRLKKPLS
jgi:predicted metal-dependent phosphoesterase TrpH